MSRVGISRVTLIAVAAVLAALIITGCAKKPMWGDPDTGLILTYRMQKDDALTYRYTNDFEQNLDIMGQTMKITADEIHVFTMTPQESKSENLMLSVTMDSIRMSIVTPQGEMTPDLTAIPGKSFEMILSPLGGELELIGADEIEYEIAGEGKRSIASTFQALFPDLPAGPVKIGDSWTSTDSIPEESENSKILLVFNTTHTLFGYETVNGMECAKITSKITGTLNGTGTQSGMDFITDATITGTDTWYFAYEKGIYVKSISGGIAEGTIKDAMGQAITIPMKREFSMALELVQMP